MIPFITGTLAAAAAFLVTRQFLSRRAARTRLSDDAIRDIERHGRVELDEPLDLREVKEEEQRFWEEETWDESEEW